MRLFVAIKLSNTPEFEKILKYLQRNLSEDQMKWVNPDNLHLTLKFFGNIPKSKIPSINKVLSNIASKTQPFQLQLSGIGQFGSQYNPKILWMNIKNPEPVKSLGETILNELNKEGFLRDRQNFVPHFTLARIKKIKSKAFYHKVIDQVRDEELNPIIVKNFTLFESKLTPNGPIYRPIRGFPLSVGNKEKPGSPLISQ